MKAWHRLTIFHDELWAVVLRRDPCVYCGDAGGTVEHVDPRGSRGTVNNGVGACKRCNNERGSAPLLIYLMWRATDRSESFHRWNWRLNAPAIHRSQLIAKHGRDNWQNFQYPEPKARALNVSIGERLGLTPSVDEPASVV